jgi:pyruvate/2-oxoglutarate dehydrogenase complex dihydrolipoamide dehydrogenase (E3) component
MSRRSARAAQLGLKTADRRAGENLGGICLNWGCIPTKALLRSAVPAPVLHIHMKHAIAEAYGLAADNAPSPI